MNRRTPTHIATALFALATLSLSTALHAEDMLTANITLKDHRFYPNQIKVPAGKRVKLVLTNTDRTPEEFESDQLRFEKIVQGGGRVTVFINPLKPGTYHFFGEFNLNTANGHIIAQ